MGKRRRAYLDILKISLLRIILHKIFVPAYAPKSCVTPPPLSPNLMTYSFATLCGLLTLSLFATSCKKDDDQPKAALTIPGSYDAAAFDTNAATELAVADRLVAISVEARKGRTTGTVVPFATLNDLYTTGTPSLQSLATPYYNGLLSNANGYLAQLSAASGGTYTPGAPVAGATGGTYGASPSVYLFDENGTDLQELIINGQYGATLYNHALTLLNGNLSATTSDRVVAIMGISPTFPSSGNATKHTRPDRLLAGYAARRDKNDGNGFYSLLKNDLIKLQAAIKAGDQYKPEQQEAIAGIKRNLERVTAATVINYCHSVISTMSQTTTTDAQKAASLHSYTECVGFLNGWRTHSAANKLITDAQIDEVLVLLNAPVDGPLTTYKLITEPVTELPKLQQVISRLKAIYGFSDAQIEDFKKNWVTEQDR